ncbi:MAG TPA: glycoside hydrolase family 97 protein [Terriglobia bacterium]|nr:glycoside hydrolase family 97 protein [Terriglobia bacterium]
MGNDNRRDFLKKLSTGVGGIALAGNHPLSGHSEATSAQEVGIAAERTSLSSPDGRLSITFQTAASENQPASTGRLVYTVWFEGKPLITPSGLGLELEGQAPLGADVRVATAARSTTDETYRLVTGKASVVRNHFNALRLELEENSGSHRQLVIEARAYDDAIAFRYVVPEQAGLHEFKLKNEKTEFRLAKDATTYSLELPSYRTMYEAEYIKLPATAFANRGSIPSQVLIGLPMLLEVPGVAWMAITEADLRNYAAMYLLNPSGNWTGHWFESRLAPQVDHPDLCVTGTIPHHSAWRVLLIGSAPGRLIESTAITSLNPESALTDTSWIHAGKVSWDWWCGSRGHDGKPAYTTETMKYYVDFAEKSGFPYMLVDAGWSVRGDLTKMNGRVDVPELARYAALKGVKIWIWAWYQDVNRQMDEAFSLFEKWGVAGVKTDFVQRDDQDGIGFYYRSAEKAAQHHLMMDYHGATKPWGIERTYPNVLSYEAVIGMEDSKAGARDNPDHRLTIPFTRMVAGPMDYTPGGFDNVTRAEFEPRMVSPMVMGTRTQQLAMYVVYQCPFQMVSDWPGAYEDQPAFKFIKDVPATWDETRVVNGQPGEFITVARRLGDVWFLGSMNTWDPRSFDVPLAFLGPGHYTAEVYADAADADRVPKHVVIDKRIVDRATHLKLLLASGGGYAARLVPQAGPAKVRGSA